MRRASYLYLMVGIMQASYMPFSSIVFRDRGVSFEAIGLVGAVNSILALTAAPIWGHLGDATLGRVAAFRLAIFATAIGVFTFAVGPFAGIPGSMLAAFAGAGIVPLLDSIGMERLAAVKGNWGTLRSVTSGSYAASSLVSGVIVVAGGAILVGPLYTAWALVILAGTVGLRVSHRPHSAATEDELEAERTELAGGNAEIAVAGNWRDRFGTVSLAFTQSPKLLSFLLLSLLANLGAGIFYSFGSLRIQELGGNASMVTLAATISATVEIPFFLIGGAIALRFGMRAVYAIGLAALGLCSFGYALDVSPLVLGVVRGLCGVGFACTLLGSVLTIRAIVPLALQATGQALFQAVSFGLAISIASIVGGVLYGALGAPPLFLLSGLILIGSIPFAWRILRVDAALATR
jgi:MFS transporter, PPP family, 3-phenylpropionic acid transporter